MNPLHIIWIVPLSGSVGFLWAAILSVSSGKKRGDGKS